jgi:hypothetical protein
MLTEKSAPKGAFSFMKKQFDITPALWYYKPSKSRRQNMWVCLNKAFLSIVQDKENPEMLVVRARRPDDISNVFPNVEVVVIPNRDYKYRTFLSREVVAAALAKEVLGVDYTNFKKSVQDRDLHEAYKDVWLRMREVQYA